MRQSGGFVTVRSAPGEGTTFEILLPGHHALPLRAGTEPRRTAAVGHETILVVEDEPKVREIVVRVLRSAGYRVLEAASGAEALERERGLGRAHPPRS